MGFIASIQNKIRGNKTKRKTLKFKTTLQCDGCIQRVKPHLENISQIEDWDVNLQNPKKVLKVVVPANNQEEISQNVIQAIENGGYAAEKLK